MKLCARHLQTTATLLLALALAACAAPAGRDRSSRSSDTTPVIAKPAATTPAATDRGDPDQRFKTALQLLKEKKPQEAQAAFLKLSQDFPQFSGPLTNLGLLQAQGRQRDAAIASLNQAIATNASNAIALNWLGILYRESGDFAKAEGSYRKALALRPDYAAVHLNLAILYELSLKQPQQAVAKYRDYLKFAGGEDLLVAAWIKQLETSATAVAAVP